MLSEINDEGCLESFTTENYHILCCFIFVLEQIFKLNLAGVIWRQYAFSISLKIDPFQLALLLELLVR